MTAFGKYTRERLRKFYRTRVTWRGPILVHQMEISNELLKAAEDLGPFVLDRYAEVITETVKRSLRKAWNERPQHLR